MKNRVILKPRAQVLASAIPLDPDEEEAELAKTDPVVKDCRAVVNSLPVFTQDQISASERIREREKEEQEARDRQEA